MKKTKILFPIFMFALFLGLMSCKNANIEAPSAADRFNEELNARYNNINPFNPNIAWVYFTDVESVFVEPNSTTLLNPK